MLSQAAQASRYGNFYFGSESCKEENKNTDRETQLPNGKSEFDMGKRILPLQSSK
jgi:hypothetical protein